MTRNCRNVLKNLRKLSNSSENVLSFASNGPYLYRLDSPSEVYDYSVYKKEIRGIIHQLVLDGYLQYSDDQYEFVITQLGLHPYQFRWESFKKFLFKSVFIPVVVSFLTTILTLVINSLLSGM